MTTTTDNFIDACGAIESAKQTLLKMLATALARPDARNYTLGKIATDMTERGQNQLVETLHSITLAEFAAIFSGDLSKKKDKKVKDKTDFPSIKKDEMPAYKADVLRVITEQGIGVGQFPRGSAPKEIRNILKRGSQNNIRQATQELEKDGVVFPTGKTKGLRFVPLALEAQASAAYAAEMASKAEKAEKPEVV